MFVKSLHIEKHNTHINLFAADVLIVMLAYGGFSRKGFGADTLFQAMSPMSNIGGSLDNGRYLNYFLNKFLYERGFLVTEHYKLCFIFFCASLVIDLFLIQTIFLPFFLQIIEASRESTGTNPPFGGYIACTALPVINVLFSENFMFSEYHINYAIAYTLGISGAFLISRKRYQGFVLLVCACLFYQTAIIPSLMLISAYLVFENDFLLDRKLIVKEVMFNSGILLVGFLDNQSSKWISDAGIIKENDIVKHISLNYRENTINLCRETILLLKNSLHLMPSLWMPFIAILFAFLFTFVPLIKQKRNQNVLTLVLLAFTELLLFYILPFLSGPECFYPRTVFTFYTVQAIFLLTGFHMISQQSIRNLLSCFCIGYLTLHILCCQFIAANRILSNNLDLLYANAVLKEIAKYETTTGNCVTKVAIANDTNAPNSYECVKYKRDQINERVLSVSPFCLLEYANGNGIALEHVAMDPDVFNSHFSGKDWDHYDADEQLVFIDDTLYWLIF